MFEEKRIKTLENRNNALVEANKELSYKVKELENRIEKLQLVVNEADKYADIHRKEMEIIGIAKQKYEVAYKQMINMQKEYQKKMDSIINNFSK